MKKNYNYNELVRFYNRSLKKLRSFLALGKNPYKQDILKRRIERLFEVLKGMQTQIKLSRAAAALAAGFVLFQPNAASAQSFPTQVHNPFSLAAAPANWSTPWFVDLDNDGDKDIMTGTASGDFHYYENVGTASVPNFSTVVTNPFNIAGIGANSYAQPSFADIDNDGDMDMFSGCTAGDIWYFENIGTASAANFNIAFTNPFGLTTIPDPYGYSAGSLVDMDNDGDLDFMSGSYSGNYYYYENTGTVSLAAFAAVQTNPFSLAAGGYYSTASFVDIDGDGDKDMFSSNGGSFDYFQNTGTAAAPVFGGVVNNPFLLTALTASLNGACASFADLDNDGDMDLMSGASNPSDHVYYENVGNVGIIKSTLMGGVSIYPNPTTNNVLLKLNNTSEAIIVEVSNALGQILSKKQVNNYINTIELPEAKGIYFVQVTTVSNKKNVYKVVKD